MHVGLAIRLYTDWNSFFVTGITQLMRLQGAPQPSWLAVVSGGSLPPPTPQPRRPECPLSFLPKPERLLPPQRATLGPGASPEHLQVSANGCLGQQRLAPRQTRLEATGAGAIAQAGMEQREGASDCTLTLIEPTIQQDDNPPQILRRCHRRACVKALHASARRMVSGGNSLL
ncbi:hypothetical protein NKDENANG_02309 [Candidatus Entotheonellaceae bacterium PAL068K]